MNSNIKERSQNLSILIVDKDSQFAKALQSDATGKPVKPVIVDSGKEAQALVSDKTQDFLAVFINSSTTDCKGVSVIRCVHTQRPLTPIFLLYEKDSPAPFSPQDLKQLGVRKVLSKPLEYSQLIELVAPSTLGFDSKVALRKAKENPDKLNEESQSSHDSFEPIRAQDFLSGATALFDLYVGLKSGRFVKILQAGDSFSTERLQEYLGKGITHFYIKKDVQKEYIDFCDQLVKQLAKREQIPTKIKVAQTQHLGTQVYNFLKERGIDEVNLRYASGFIDHVRTLTSQLKLDQSDAFAELSQNISVYQHSVGTTMLSSMLAKALEVDLPRPAQILGIASMFHDISSSKSTLSLEESEAEEHHSTKSADIVRNVRGVEPLAIQAIEQHHFHKEKKSRTSLIKISKMAEIIGICDEFDRLMRLQPTWTISEISAHFEKEIFDHFSRQIVYAFRTAFFPRINQGSEDT